MTDEDFPGQKDQQAYKLLREAHAITMRLLTAAKERPRQSKGALGQALQMLPNFARQDAGMTRSIVHAALELAGARKTHLKAIEQMVLPLIPMIAERAPHDASWIMQDLLKATGRDPAAPILRRDFMRTKPSPGSGRETWFIPHTGENGATDIIAVTGCFKGDMQKLSAAVVEKHGRARDDSFWHYDCILSQASMFKMVAAGMMAPKQGADYAANLYAVKYLTFNQ